jgi:hypothetical protein
MKYLIILFLFPATVFSQTCKEKIDAARKSREAGNYELSIKQFQAAAAASCDTDSVNIEDEILEIFKEIEYLKEKADRAKKAADIATIKANEARIRAENAEREVRIALKSAEIARNDAQLKSDTLKRLYAKSDTLEATFKDSNTYSYLYKTGEKHFEYDKKAQSRDYQNALTYFALARFLKPVDTLNSRLNTDSLGSWVHAARFGREAEDYFRAGDLKAAHEKYIAIKDTLKKLEKDTSFEQLRLDQIKEVDSLFTVFKVKNKIDTTTVAKLTGNWWTLPKEFSQYKNIEAIKFKSNLTNFVHFPEILAKLPKLNALNFEDCVNLQNINNWDKTPNLTALSFKNNKNLYAITQLDSLPNISSLAVDSCPAFTLIEGAKTLKSFTTEKSYQLRIAQLLLDNKGLETLKLADLPEPNLNVEFLEVLQSLTLSRMDVENLQGLDKNKQLKNLKINQLNKLTAFTPPSQLAAVSIANCKGLKNLDKWTASDSLSSLSLFSNESITLLPDWKKFSHLKTLAIVNARDVEEIKGTQALLHADRIYLINNTSLKTNSIHAGFGFDWTFLPSSLKFEAEHRRLIKLFNKSVDAGFKAVAAYFRKDFSFPEDKLSLKSKGIIGGAVMTYYSPYWIYTGIGIGAGRFDNQFVNKNPRQTTNLVWINNLGIQLAPHFLKKDKISINMDLYTVFVPKDYYILPSFGFTYYKTLGFSKNTILVRPGDARRTVRIKNKDGNEERIDIDKLFEKLGN